MSYRNRLPRQALSFRLYRGSASFDPIQSDRQLDMAAFRVPKIRVIMDIAESNFKVLLTEKSLSLLLKLFFFGIQVDFSDLQLVII